MRGVKKQIRDNKYLSWILIITNWFFQSIVNADKTEKIYKISFTLIFWLIFYAIFTQFFTSSSLKLGVISFIIAHT
ncbi:MAG: hypothetical protein KAJ28_12505, partial [Flavobacteriaceae bacterium]|nr:hypothetical protein [Flavobacteriaceae bacterium]